MSQTTSNSLLTAKISFYPLFNFTWPWFEILIWAHVKRYAQGEREKGQTGNLTQFSGWSHASVYFLTILIKPLPRLFYRGKINKYILFYVVHSFLYVKSPIKYQILFHSLIRILENKQYVIKTVDNTNISVRFQVSESERIGHVAREDGGYVRKKTFMNVSNIVNIYSFIFKNYWYFWRKQK